PDPAALRAQDITEPYGKIFHLKADGSGVPTNPYYDAANPASTPSKVFARGFRNPFRFGIDPTLGLPVTGEVGYNNYEEVDVVQRGGNYGWPCWEAGHPTPGYSALPGCAGVPNTTPLVEYPPGTGPNQGNSAVGGIVYTGNSYPDSYRGAFFFGDYVSQQIWTVHYDDKGNLVTGPETPPVFTGMGGPVKFGAAPNGDIVYADIYTGKLQRLSYSTTNKAPIVNVTTSTNPDTRTVTFDASSSVDYDNDPVKYYWDFGDGTTADDTPAQVTHTYPASPDKFTATATVKDPLGAAVTATVTDSAGVTASKTYVAQPRQHRITLTSTQPAKVTIPVEGDVNTALVTEGASFDLQAEALATDGVSKFTGWQGGPATQSWT